MSAAKGDPHCCSVCWEVYEDTDQRLPRVLLCGHTFCSNCLVSIHNSAARSIVCPACRSTHRISQVLTSCWIVYALIPPGIKPKPRVDDEKEVYFKTLHYRSGGLSSRVRKFLSDSFSDDLAGVCITESEDVLMYFDHSSPPCWSGGLPKPLDNKLRGRQRSLPLRELISVGAGNSYFVSFKDGRLQWSSRNDEMDKFVEKSSCVDVVAFGPDGQYFAQLTDGRQNWSLPAQLSDRLNGKKHRNKKVKDIALLAKGYFVLFQNGSWFSDGLPDEFLYALNEIDSRPEVSVEKVCISPDGQSYCILCTHESKYIK
eukprot:TRINITY_DN6601_c0_g2_i1.p1 TRINITY_DN6601_c0_g2~~TRINITY_DN6601_c0_g2_i1.p1  ORF type:complete len:314 (-),score=60.55 TRINITY_DN6601_c0_g2_i1:33-974(-)